MPDELARPGGGGLSRLTPEVKTLAKPDAVPLIGARGVVQRSAALKATFEQAKAEGWTPERLAGAITPPLEQALDCEPEAAVEVAQYLADEYFQLGEAVLLCDRNTGKALARITDEDIYQPPPVPRESGSLAQPPSRLNPNLEGFLVSYIFEAERDQTIRAELARRLPQTPFLHHEDDPRLHAVTRAGRLAIAQDVRAALPDVLEGVQGGGRAFLAYFEHGPGAVELDSLPRRTAEAQGRQNIVDPKAMNLRFSWEATIKARTGAAWVREIAAHMVNEAARRVRHDLRLTVSHPLLTRDHIEGYPFWVGSPDVLRALQTIPTPDGRPSLPMISVLPCIPQQPWAVGFPGSALGPIGSIDIIPDTYDFSTREVHGRWEMAARMDYLLYMNWDRVRFIHVTDIPAEGIAEIL